MKTRFDTRRAARIAGLLGAIATTLVGMNAQAHVFDVRSDGADGEWRGNENYASWYDWSGTQRNYELSSGERHSYALQIFSLSTRILGADAQLVRSSAYSDSWYSKPNSNPARYSAMQGNSLVVMGSEIWRCTNSSGCGDVHELPTTTFYSQSRSISFGTLLGSSTIKSSVVGDLSVDVALTSSSTKYLGLETGLLTNSRVKLLTGVHVRTRQTFPDGTSDYRLLDVDIDAEEQARQGTTRSDGTTTKGSLSWRNLEFVDMAQMDGALRVKKSSPISSKTVTLVDVPTFVWSGQWVDDVGSTKAF